MRGFLFCKEKEARLTADFFFGGPDRIRTDDPYNANVMRSQLRYRPMGYGGIIPPVFFVVKNYGDFFPSLLGKIVL